MTGPLSLILLFIPVLVPQFTARYLGGTTLVWLVSFFCLIVAAYRSWLLEHRGRIAEKLDPLIEDADLPQQFWENIQYDRRDSELIRFPLAGFDVKEWQEVHKQLARLFFWTNLQAHQVQRRFNEIGITEQPHISTVMGNQNLRGSMNGLDYTKMLGGHAAMLAEQRKRISA